MQILSEMSYVFIAQLLKDTVGNDGKQSDIYIYNYETQDLINLTNDWFSEEDPSWSIDGEKIYFISKFI